MSEMRAVDNKFVHAIRYLYQIYKKAEWTMQRKIKYSKIIFAFFFLKYVHTCTYDFKVLNISLNRAIAVRYSHFRVNIVQLNLCD